MAIAFTIAKKSKKSRARMGVISTPHGDVETPALVTVATQAAVKALTNDQAAAAGSKLLIANTLHLHLKPGGTIVKNAGGLQEFMAWNGPMMTDSGGFQVFSLGFGRDFGMGKILKEKSKAKIGARAKPKLLTIGEDGVLFTSYLDGKKIFMGPKDSIRIQEAIGADIIFAFDECTSPIADRAYTIAAMERTHRWAKVCLDAQRTKQALFGIVQGGKFLDLRRQSAKIIGAMPFAGFGIGGEFGADKRTMSVMIRAVVNELPDEKPRHLLGIGHPEDIRRIIKEGIDTFDCTVPTHYARHGTAFTSRGRIEIGKAGYYKDRKPLDPACECPVCTEHSRAYLCHLFRAKEMTAGTLLTMHNLHFFNGLVVQVRNEIRRGKV
ncbi:tRNA guanosine(34) transglycosylase Tgt [Candidatus Uhrbacteria bacterium]|nr:tRNA guanosine(34) transglycosylase Tgt [Candidatus Uhrbacteria bacterium]